MPTEAQWEWACRAGTTTRYYFNDAEADLPIYANFIRDEDGFPAAAPVGKFKPNH